MAREMFGCLVFRVPNPFWPCREAQRRADQGSRLFERSEFSETPPGASIAGCPKRSVGTRTAGSPFFWVLFFGRRPGGEAKNKYLARRGETRHPA